MANNTSNRKKRVFNGVKRDFVSGRFVGLIDADDAKRFASANAALTREIRKSSASAVRILKASGFLTASGKLSTRYK